MPSDNRSLLELLYSVSREVATALDLRTVLQRVLYAAMDNVGGERGSIVVMDDQGKPLDSVIVYGKQVQGDTTRQLRVTVERGLAGWVVRNRKAAIVPDTSLDPRWVRRPDDAEQKSGAKAAICVPLMAREKMLGALTLVHSVPNVFDRSHLDLMQAIADQAGVAIMNARLYTESQRQARVMSALAEGAATINASLQVEDVYQRILNQTLQALNVDTVALAMEEAATGDFVFRAATGKQAGNILGKRVRQGEGAIGKVVRERRGIVIPKTTEDASLPNDNFVDITLQGIALAPIQAQGRVIGVIQALNPHSDEFDPDALLVMTGIGSLAGTTIQNAQLFQEAAETRKRYFELFHNSIDPILITDIEGNVLEANRQALLLSQLDARTVREMNIEGIHAVSREHIGIGFDLSNEKPETEYESVLYVKKGKDIPVQVYVRNIVYGKDEAIQWIFRDIRESKALDTLRDDLTSMIYHDLRSPLANVSSSLELLQDILPEDDEATISLLRIANNSTHRMQRLIASLLDINRLEAGQSILTKQGVSPERIIHEAVEAVRPTAEARKQHITVNMTEKLPNIWVDEDMIKRVLINLLENASKFSSQDDHIEIGAKVKDESIYLWVSDNGVGIPEKDRARVFEKFARAGDEKKVSGFGVGLAFCRLAINGHGGEIWVDERPAQGAKFNIQLPIEQQ